MKKINLDIDFADSSYQSCKTINTDLIIYLNSWDDQIIKIIFINAIKFTYLEGSFLEGIYEKNNENSFLTEALDSYYEEIPLEQSFKNFVIMDIDDQFLFNIVAENVSASKQKLMDDE